MDASEFLAALRSQVPEVETTIDEHLAEYEGELLLHLLLGDLLRVAIGWFAGGRNDELARLLLVLERGVNDGDGYVENAVAVSFVEDTGWWDDSMRGFVASWPKGLVNEAKRQR
jgi:hypothetical protein